MIMGKEKLIPILAMAVLLVAISSTLYVTAQQSETNDMKMIQINNEQLNIDELYNNINTITIETDDGEKTGLPLDEVLEYSKVSCIECNSYTIKAKEPYQQTVSGSEMKNGILTYDEKYNARVYFPNLAHSFWVYNIVEIEVK